MMIKKILLSVLIVFFISSIASAQTGERVLGGWLYDVPKTTVAPTIDGAVDAVWKTVDWVFQNSYDNG
ncbi:MAG: hypothetical protein V1720_15495, partial [bacterium]